MADTNVVFAIGPSVYESEIIQKKTTIDKLFKKLSTPKLRNKKDGPYFVFASFNDNKRNAHSVKFYYGATLDLDNSKITPKEINQTLRKLNCRFCIYTTHNHKAPDKGNRYRIVIPYKEPVHKEKHVETTVYLNYLFGTEGVDTSAKALSRPMYFPSCPEKRQKHFFFFDNEKANLLDPEKKIEIPAHIKWEIEELNQSHTEKVDITQELTEGARNDHIAKVTGTLIQQGKTLQEIIDFCDEINQLKFSPPMKVSQVVRTVKSVWKSHTRNHDDKDWSYEQIAERIKKTNSIDNDLDHLLEAIATSVRKGKTSPLQSDKLLKALKKRDNSLSLSSLRSELTQKKKDDVETTKKSKNTISLDESDSPVVDKIRKEYSPYYFVASQNMVYNRKYKTFYKLEGFNNQHSVLKQDFGYTQLSPFRILDEIGAIRKVDAVRYHPGQPSMFNDTNGMQCLNTYTVSDVKPYKGKVDKMLRHFEYLFPSKFERDVILDFIAFNYQHPGEKLMWAPIIKGRKGIGKTIIADYILAPIFGSSNVRSLNNSQPLMKEFNAWQADTQLVVIQELFISNRIDVKQLITESLKSFITDKFLSVRKMHTDAFQTDNVANMMAFTNHEDALYVTHDERRFCMIRCEVEPRNSGYYRRLVNFLENNQEAIAYFFKKRKIRTIEQHRLPLTKYTQDIMGTSLNWAEMLVADELKDEKSLLRKHKAFTWTGICHVALSCLHDGGESVQKHETIFNAASSYGRMLRQALIEAGFKRYEADMKNGGRVRVNGKLESVWITPHGIEEKFNRSNVNLVKREASKCASVAEVEFQKHLC